jgi:glycosyltransferase involved in cell wall biosynthesis
MIKIVHVINSIDPADGGPPTVVMRLSAAQALLGNDVHVVSYVESSARERIDQAIAQIPGRDRVHLHLLTPANRFERLTGRTARPLISSVLKGAQFVHLHGVWESILLYAATAARRAAIPYCVRPAGMLDPWSMRQKPWKKRLALLSFFRRMLDGAAFIHTLNQDEARLLAPLNLRAPSRTIPNGISLEEIDPLPLAGTFRARMHALHGRRFVIFISRLHTKKGLDYLADAFTTLALTYLDVDLVVAGPDYGAEASFRDAVRQAGLNERVYMVGPLYGTDKIAALVDADCFCLPSRQEGFSLAVTEALACGVPVVISKQCHFPEVASAGAGVVVDLDPAEIAEALNIVLSDPAKARQMGRAGRRLVEQHYTWGRIAEDTIKAYRATMVGSSVLAPASPLPAKAVPGR